MSNQKKESPRSGNKPAARRGTVAAAAFLCACLLSVTVFGTVYYDSSKDPVVAYSAMEAYVGEQVESIRASLLALDERVAVVELTGGGGGGGDISMTSAGALQLLNRISALETGLANAESENKALRAELTTAKNELNALISNLNSNFVTLESTVSSLSEEVSSLQNQIASVKTNVTTLQKNFSQISDISTKLETLIYKVNSLTSDTGDVSSLKKNVAALQTEYAALLERMGQLYEAVKVPYNATVYAKDPDDSLVVVLRTGTAVAVSPFTEAGTAQGLNDLSDGLELYDGASIPLFHNILIPRGGTDGRGIRVTSAEDTYMMIGGDYIIVE